MRDKSSATYTHAHTTPHSSHAVSGHSPSVRHWAVSQTAAAVRRSDASRPPCASSCACPYRCLCRSRCRHVGCCVCVSSTMCVGVRGRQQGRKKKSTGTEAEAGTQPEGRNREEKGKIHKLYNRLRVSSLFVFFCFLFSGPLRRACGLSSLALFSPFPSFPFPAPNRHEAQDRKRDDRGEGSVGESAGGWRGHHSCHKERACSIQQHRIFQRTAGSADEHAPNTGCALVCQWQHPTDVTCTSLPPPSPVFRPSSPFRSVVAGFFRSSVELLESGCATCLLTGPAAALLLSADSALG
jgi:hypothetical protein